MNIGHKKLFTLYACTVFSSIAWSQFNVIRPNAVFLLMTPDARAGSMGDAGYASIPDVYSSHWNISKLPFYEKNNSVAFSYTPWLRNIEQGINFYNIFINKRIYTKNAVSLSANYLNTNYTTYFNPYTYITSFNSQGTIPYQLQEFPKEYCINLGYARLLHNKFSIGITGKYIHSRLMERYDNKEYTGTSFAGDIALYRRDSITANSVLSFGIVISNIGGKISYYRAGFAGTPQFLAQNLGFGTSYKINVNPLNSLELIFDANKLLVPTPPKYDWATGNIIAGRDPNRSVINVLYSSFYDAPGGFKEELHEITIGGGIEYGCYKTVALRSGYFYEHETKGGRKYFTFGLGLKYAGIGLDGSYVVPASRNTALKNTWRISLSWEPE